MLVRQHASDHDTYSPDDCRWRAVVSRENGEIASCRLLEQLFGLQHKDQCLVARDVCKACCNTFPATFETLNPVVASLVYDRARSLAPTSVKSGAGQNFHALRVWAEQHLGIEAPPLPPLKPEPATEMEAGPVRTLRELLPPPSAQSGQPVQHWAVGVTTAPRRQSYLGQCLDSLAEAGWPRPHLFIDGAMTTPSKWSSLPTTCRDEQVGAWPNYYLSLLELLMREPLADAYLIVQDDSLFYCRENMRQYLERVLWPGDRPGIVSLYCPEPHAQPRPGWYQYPARWSYGAIAAVFPRQIAERLAIAPMVFRHRWAEGDRGRVGIPDVIADWAQATLTPMYYPSPSLVQHIGETSSIWPGAYQLTSARRACSIADDCAATTDSNPSHQHSSAQFPETAFPCPPAHEANYRSCIARGRERMADATAVICGVGRDLEAHLRSTREHFERLASMFRTCYILIFENDSSDKTPDLLRAWAAENCAVRVISEHLEQPKINYGVSRERTERMAYYRNRCRERVLADFSNYDFVLVADMDLEGGWSYDGIANTFGHDDWDFVGSNGLDFETGDGEASLIHWDTFAFRPIGQTHYLDRRDIFRFRRGEPLFPVWSCFGGLGIYRMECYRAAAYSGDDCEHVTFHRAIRERGFDRLFLNPSQIVLYSSWSTVS